MLLTIPEKLLSGNFFEDRDECDFFQKGFALASAMYLGSCPLQDHFILNFLLEVFGPFR